MKTIKDLIVQRVKKSGTIKSSDISTAFKISRQAAHGHLSDLLRSKTLLKQGSSKAKTYYILNNPKAIKALQKDVRRFKKRIPSKNASEDISFQEASEQKGLLENISPPCLENLHYAFTEMLNNAIDHSRSKLIDIEIVNNGKIVSFDVIDKGVGVFENIRKQFGLANELEAITELLKGKRTTAPKEHSGEGIFFTSKIADRFLLESHGKRLIIDNHINDIFIEDIRRKKGTTVHFELGTDSRKKLAGLFKQYVGEDFKFDRSGIKVKLFGEGENYISRSQAKRLLHSLEDFRSAVLDFDGVKTVGQGFADEVFRVFKRAHPEVEISYLNAAPNVEFMIRRAKD